MMPQIFVFQPSPHRKYRQAARSKRWSTGQPQLLIGQPQGPENNQEHDPGPQVAADVTWGEKLRGGEKKTGLFRVNIRLH